MKKKTAYLMAALFPLLARHAFAQNIFFNQPDATPQIINPAFTGSFNGDLRATAFYNDHWNSIDIPYTAYGIGIDAPVLTMKNGDYIGVGFQALNGVAGDGNVRNYYFVASAAYHKALSILSAARNTDLSFGLQSGYMKSMTDLSSVYFNQILLPYFAGIGFTNYPVLIESSQARVPVNAGMSFAQTIAPSFNYIIGIAGFNLTQSTNTYQEHADEIYGADIHGILSLGANWQFTNRLMLRPSLLYQFRQSQNDILTGAEVNLRTSQRQSVNKSAFIGAYYSTGHTMAYTAGIDFSFLRVGFSYQYATFEDNPGTGNFEIMVKYTVQKKRALAKQRLVPCNRF